MGTKPALLYGTDASLVYSPAEGTPTGSPTVALYDEAGVQWTTTSPTVTIVGATLTTTVPAGLLDTYGAKNLRARWTYTVGSTSYTADQLFDCVQHAPRPTLNAAKLLSDYWPMFTGREFVTDRFDTLRAAAWTRLAELLWSRGIDINWTVDPLPLEEAHAHLTAAVIARNYRPGPTTEWGAFAERATTLAQEAIDRALANTWWLDKDQDLKPGGDEQEQDESRAVLRR